MCCCFAICGAQALPKVGRLVNPQRSLQRVTNDVRIFVTFKNRYKHLCIVFLRPTGQNQVDTIIYAAPDDPAHNIDLDRCDDDSILTVRAFLVQTDELGGQFGDRCDTTPTFAEFCDATVRCRFTQTEYRDAVRDVCGADYDQAQMTFVYSCLSGTRPFTEDLLVLA